MIRLSIITPTYNRLDKLRLNIKSVLAQDFKDKEHIIVDNLSNDGTDKFISNYASKADFPVRYIREKDTGIYNAMNKGIKAAKGEWIHILNSDDYYYSYRSLKEVFDRDVSKYDILLNGVIVVKNYKKNYWKPEYRPDINHYNFPHPGVIIKKRFYKLNGYYNEKFRIISDALFFIDHFPKANCLVINKPLTVLSCEGTSSEKSLQNLYEKLLCITFYHKFPLFYKLKLIFSTLFGFLKEDY